MQYKLLVLCVFVRHQAHSFPAVTLSSCSTPLASFFTPSPQTVAAENVQRNEMMSHVPAPRPYRYRDGVVRF